MKHFVKFFVLVGLCFGFTGHAALQVWSYQDQALPPQSVTCDSERAVAHPSQSISVTHQMVAQTPSIFKKIGAGIGGLAASLWKGRQAVQEVSYACPKHRLSVYLSAKDARGPNVLSKIQHECQIAHAHLPQTQDEAKYVTQLLHARGRGVPVHQVPLPFEATPEAWHTAVERDAYGFVLGFAGEVELQLLSAVANDLRIVDGQTLSPEHNAALQRVEEAGKASIQTGSITGLYDATVDALESVHSNVRTGVASIEPAQRGHTIQAIQKGLMKCACNRSRVGDAAGAVNATGACLLIDQVISEAGPVMYTSLGDTAMGQMVEIYINHALVMATGLHESHPDVAQYLVCGPRNEYATLAPDLAANLGLGRAALRGVGKGAINFAEGISQTLSHPVETVEKVYRAAKQICAVLDHVFTNDAILKLRRHQLLALQVHDTLAVWEQQRLADATLQLAIREEWPTAMDACVAVRNLSLNEIRTVCSRAGNYLSSEEGVERVAQVGTEAGLGIITGRCIAGALAGVAEGIGGVIPVMDELNGALALADGSAVAFSDGAVASVGTLADSIAHVGAVAEMGTPATQLFAKMGSEQPQRGFQLKPPGKDQASSVQIFEKNAKHIFRNTEGHLPIDTPENRKLLLDLASDMKNHLGTDVRGHKWFGRILPDGRQLWAEVREHMIRNGGVNEIQRVFNPKTGLSRLPVKK